MSRNNRQNRDDKKRKKLAKQKRHDGSGKPPKVHITRPSAITDEIRTFCNEISPAGTPQYVDVRSAPRAQLYQCFVNVERYAAENGGSICYGWNVMEWPGVLLEAEFHAVWQGSGGELLDVTPRADGERRLLFLPDPNRVYDGKLTPSHQRAVPGAPPEATTFIDAVQACWTFQSSRFVDDGAESRLSMSKSDVLYFNSLQLEAQAARRKLLTALAQRQPTEQ
jgi:hypothetical protein